MNHSRHLQIILQTRLSLLTGDVCPHHITTSPCEHFLCELLQAGSPSRSQDLQTLLHAKEHQHVLAVL